MRYSLPSFFVSADSKEFTDTVFVSADSKGVTGGQFRPKPDKTRCLLISADSKGLRGACLVKHEGRRIEG